VLTLLCWNVNARAALRGRQIEAVARREPDLVGLQEVRSGGLGEWREGLAAAGLPHLLDSGPRAQNRANLCLLASRFPLAELDPIEMPQPERELGALVGHPAGELELRTVHVPPAGAGGGELKLATCEALFAGLARRSARPRILCGDLNTPQAETAEGGIVTWADHHPGQMRRWDLAERNLLDGLAAWDLADAFRGLHGYGVAEASWVGRRFGREVGYRIDHVLAAAALRPLACEYLHGWREAGLSDHSPIEARFGWGG
jgi:exonuclease III